MVELGCIVSQNNVYVNIQESLKPTDLDFKLEDEEKWKQFLTDRMKSEYFDRG